MANTRKIKENLEVQALTTTADLTVTDDAAITGDATVGATLGVTGATTLGSTLGVTGVTTLTGGVAGNTTFQNNVNITGDLAVTGSFSFAGGAVFPDNTFEIQDEGDVTKVVKFSVGGATTATNTTFIASQTASRSLTLPDASTNLVGHNTTDTLSNKSLVDASTSIIDDGDATKVMKFEVSGITTATTRTLTMPDANVNLGALTNSNIDAAAAIDYSKLALTDDIVNADINSAAAIAYSKLNLSTSIVNADINAAAAIARSKTASGTNYRILANDATGVMSENAAITAAHVVYADANGQLAGEAALLETRGGTAQSTYTAGDTLYSSASNTLSKLAIGTAGQILKTSDAGIPSWEDRQNASKEYSQSDDFSGGTAGGILAWQSWSGGGTAAASNVSTNIAGHPGIVRLSTGTTAGVGRAGFGLSPSANPVANGIILSADSYSEEWLINIGQLSTAGDEFFICIGLHAQPASNAQSHSALFRYDRLNLGTNWQADTSQTSTLTRTDTGVAVATGWVKLKIVANTTNVRFYINGALVATNSTNLPTACVASGLRIEKSAGITSTYMEIDYFQNYLRFSSAR